MNWEQLELPEPPKAMPRTGDLSVLDYWKLYLVTKAIKKSLMSVVQTALLTYLQRNWDAHEERLKVEAKLKNLTLEEYCQKLINKELD
ncbi:MAG: hypothetical protein ACRDBG_06175 [Waterburya sp.]